MIEKHMFPLNITALPKYRETLVIVLVDKYCGLLETVIPRLKKLSSPFLKLMAKRSRTAAKAAK